MCRIVRLQTIFGASGNSDRKDSLIPGMRVIPQIKLQFGLVSYHRKKTQVIYRIV